MRQIVLKVLVRMKSNNMGIVSDSGRKNLKYIKFDYSDKKNEAIDVDADYEELDENGWTKRFVTKFKDGRYGFADSENEYLTFLPEASIYPLSELALDEIPLYEITKEEFEEVWTKAVEQKRN